jgi:hypothetical protein
MGDSKRHSPDERKPPPRKRCGGADMQRAYNMHHPARLKWTPSERRREKGKK